MSAAQGGGYLVAIAALLCAGALVTIDPAAALAAGAGALGLAAVAARPALLRFAVMALVLTPTFSLVRTTSGALAASQLAQSIESGSTMNRSAATILFVTGLLCIGLRFREIRQVNLLPWAGLFLALVFASVAWSDSSALTVRRSVEALFIIVFALGAGGVYLANRADGAAQTIRMICWASSLLSFAILAAFAIRGEIHLMSASWRLGHEGTENQVGWMASVGLLLAWVTSKRRDIWPRRAALRFNLLVPVLVVLLTKSREVWLGVLAGIAVMKLAEGRSLRKGIAKLALFAAVIGVLAATPVVQNLWARGATEEDLQSASGRTQLWEAAWPLIRGNLLAGHGMGAFWTPATVVALSTHWSPTSLHNGYLDTVAELGLIGMLVLMLTGAFAARNALRLMKRPQDREVGLAALVLYTCLVVVNAFGSVLEVFNYFPVTATLVLTFFVSRRLSAGAIHKGQ